MLYCFLWTATVHIFLIGSHQIIFVFFSGVICQHSTMRRDLYWPFETNPVCLGKTSLDGLGPYLTRTSFHWQFVSQQQQQKLPYQKPYWALWIWRLKGKFSRSKSVVWLADYWSRLPYSTDFYFQDFAFVFVSFMTKIRVTHI